MKKIFVVILLLLPSLVFSQDIGNYLILNDIGEYKYRPKRTSEIYGNSGILIPTGHFDMDHDDVTYRTRYVHPVTILGISVEVTQHAGSDSDKWLLHEVDAEFRNYYGIPDESYILKKIDGNTIFAFGSGGWDYRWISGSKVVVVEYTDLDMKKPEPIEIVKTYLAKHPSTLASITLKELRSKENVTKWIKDEMDRRLWLCDKWFMAFQLGKAEQKDVLEESVKSMQVFLDYREKYYGISAKDDKIALSNYLYQNDGTSIKNKLAEYKAWWTANKGNPINL